LRARRTSTGRIVTPLITLDLELDAARVEIRKISETAVDERGREDCQ
jgi:hypothetical protein